MLFYTVIQIAICIYIVVLAITAIYCIHNLEAKIFMTLFSIPVIIIGICWVLWTASMSELGRDYTLTAIGMILIFLTLLVSLLLDDKFNN